MKNVNLSHSTCAAMDSLCVFARILSAEIPENLGKVVARLSAANQRFFAFFYHGSVTVEAVPDSEEAREIFVKIVNTRRFRGRVYYYNHRQFSELTRENWDLIRRTIAPAKRENLSGDEKIYVEKRPSYEKIFEDGKHTDRYKKPSKRGFEKTWKTNYRFEKKYSKIVTP